MRFGYIQLGLLFFCAVSGWGLWGHCGVCMYEMRAHCICTKAAGLSVAEGRWAERAEGRWAERVEARWAERVEARWAERAEGRWAERAEGRWAERVEAR